VVNAIVLLAGARWAGANTPGHERKDFTLYVDEFQNFATDSFETILSEARKYRLSLVLANQFMTQLKEELREAILGNVGTTITGRIGTTDAEIMVKRYTPVFTAEDLTKLPNFESVCVAQINGTPSAPFSMAWIPPMGEPNQQLSGALKKLSAAKYGRPRDQVERDIAARISVQQPSQPAGGSPGEKARCALVRSFFHWNASHRRRAAPRRYCCADRPDDGWPEADGDECSADWRSPGCGRRSPGRSRKPFRGRDRVRRS